MFSDVVSRLVGERNVSFLTNYLGTASFKKESFETFEFFASLFSNKVPSVCPMLYLEEGNLVLEWSRQRGDGMRLCRLKFLHETIDYHIIQYKTAGVLNRHGFKVLVQQVLDLVDEGT